jgi:hypothetical protein
VSGEVVRAQKKPVVVEAMRFTDEPGGLASELVAWIEGNRHIAFYDPKIAALNVVTLEGTMLAVVGDWIIKGVKGEFYPCKPDIFLDTYVLVNDD